MRIYLRSLELSDVDRIVVWRNDIEVTSSLGGNTYFTSTLRELEWLKKIILNDEKNIRLAICITSDNQHIGNINLTSINWINQCAEFSIMIGDKSQWGKGYGKEATKLILKYAFAELNLNRVYLTVREDNNNAIKLYKKNGFIEEGIQRKALFKNNNFINILMMSILKTEFNEQL